MSELSQSLYSQIIIMSLLGSTEGKYYKDGSGLHDGRADAVVSTGNSGLSFGLMQNDVANNAAAETLFSALLADAVAHSRITQLQSDDFAARASIQGLRTSGSNFNSTELGIIETQVLEPGLSDIKQLDSTRAQIILQEVDETIDAIKTFWGDAGVFDPFDSDYTENPEYLIAIGYLASWANRTGNLNTMEQWLTGNTVGDLDDLTGVPSLSDIVYYLSEQVQFESNPGELDYLTGNIERGLNMLPPLIAPLGQLDIFPDLAPSPDLSSYIPGARTPYNDAKPQASPLVIDLSSGHSGVQLTTFNASTTSTFFDFTGSGFEVQTAWVSGDTGLLARDLDSNGKIDDVSELFGSPSVDGFAKLAVLDSNHDLRIDINDAAWSTLVVWTDANGDAETQSGELHSLTDLNIASIDLAGLSSSTSTISGNPISHTSLVRFTSGATAIIADAWFVHDAGNSYFSGDYTLDSATLFLPSLRGAGWLPDLTIAMSLDSDLKDVVVDILDNFTVASFSDPSALDDAIKAIMYKWAGVDGVDPDGRGDAIDGVSSDFWSTCSAKIMLAQRAPQGRMAPFLIGDRRIT